MVGGVASGWVLGGVEGVTEGKGRRRSERGKMKRGERVGEGRRRREERGYSDGKGVKARGEGVELR